MPGTLNAIKSAFLDCFSNSTGHGLARMAKPDNVFLRVLWALFFIVALVGGSVLISQSVKEYLQFGVITSTKIKREAEMTLPAITICDYFGNITKDMILQCYYGTGEWNKYRINTTKNMALYHSYGYQLSCVQLNHGINLTELDISKGEGYRYSYSFYLYIPPDSYVFFAVTDNSARLVVDEVREEVYPGHLTNIVLSKTVQSALGPPYSTCNETQEFRQVNCVEECFNKNMSEICGCEYPAGCGDWSGWTDECQNAYWENRSAIESNCNLQCPFECNQVSFPFNRVDVEWDISRGFLDYYKPIISAKFNITGQTDEEIKKSMTQLSVYFGRLETTEIFQSPSMTSTNLVGNVGGLLGKLNLSLNRSFNLLINSVSNRPIPWIQLTLFN